MTSVRYSCKTLKTCKINNTIILVKSDKLTPYDDHRIFGLLFFEETFN